MSIISMFRYYIIKTEISVDFICYISGIAHNNWFITFLLHLISISWQTSDIQTSITLLQQNIRPRYVFILKYVKKHYLWTFRMVVEFWPRPESLKHTSALEDTSAARALHWAWSMQAKWAQPHQHRYLVLTSLFISKVTV